MERYKAPALGARRLILRVFERRDLEALFALYRDREVNRFLPWFPAETAEEAWRLEQRQSANGWSWAVCPGAGEPVGYVHLGGAPAYDLGYALRREVWGRGYATEACRAVLDWAASAGVPFVTATHDRNNPKSGAVMIQLGMCYQYSYEEFWRPKGFPVIFRLYQCGLDGRIHPPYGGYWEQDPGHFYEKSMEARNENMFRPMRRNRQQLSQAECEEILNQGTSGVLAVAGDEGYPYAVPLSYVYTDGKLYFHCAKSGHKLDALKREPRVSFCVIAQDQVVPEEYTTYYRSVILFGRARVLEDEGEKRSAVEALARKYAPGDTPERRTAYIEKEYNLLCMVEVAVEHMTGKGCIEFLRKREQEQRS